MALRHHPAVAGGRAGGRDGGAALLAGARSRGEALLHDDGAGRGAPHGGVAQARRGGGRPGRARPVPRPARPSDPRGGDARGEDLPDPSLLRAADHPALPHDRSQRARDRARGPLQPADGRRRHPPPLRCGVRARPAFERRPADEAETRRRGQPAVARLHPARAVASEGARGGGAADVRDGRPHAPPGHRARGAARAVLRARRLGGPDPRLTSRSTVELRRWPRKNDPDAIRARQEALRALVGDDGTVFWEDLEPWARATEALTGVAVVPVAVVGPLDVELGAYELVEPAADVVERGRSRDAVFVPLANTEGGLALSLSRGARAVAESGGFRTYVLRDRMTRACAFLFRDTAEAAAFATWIEAQVGAMQE